MLYDVRAVRFIKTTAENPIKKNTKADYICLGHFDMMHVDDLNDEDHGRDEPLERIREDRVSGRESQFLCPENYLYSLYILKHVNEKTQKEVAGFWHFRSTFTVITRIHCDYPADWTKRKRLPFSKIIEKYCWGLTKDRQRDRCVLELSGIMNAETGGRAQVKCLFYDSLELGDTVAIMKSSSLAAILDVVRKISDERCVRDTYSYCGIYRALVQGEDSLPQSVFKKGAVLDHVSTRFSVRSNRHARAYFQELGTLLKIEGGIWNDLSFVTGTADHVISWGVCTEEKLLRVIRTLVQLSEKMHGCFNDVITRVGITQKEEDPSCIEWPEEKKTGIQHANSFKETMQWLRRDVRDKKAPSWKYTLLKLLGTLETMGDNYVMDDLAQLITPGVEALLERLSFLREQGKGQIPEKYDLEITEFLNHWASLSNDIAQLESQLTQHPELSPVRYYIPAMILQFELKFVMKVCQTLSDDGERSFQPMLIPSGMENLNTICTLDPRHEKYTGKCPLLVFIPIRDLYRPWEIAHRITHEMAHYCEDSGRNRQERHMMLLGCMAAQLVECWYRKYVFRKLEKEDGALYFRSMDCQKELTAILSQIVQMVYPDVEKWYLSKSEGAIQSVVKMVMEDDRYLQQYLHTVCPDYFYIQRNNRFLNTKELHSDSVRLMYDVTDHLKELTYLCAECYADIAMVLLLQCDFEDYYRCIYHDEFLHLKEHYKDVAELPQTKGVLRHVQRMALVLRVVSCLPGWENETWQIEKVYSDFGNRYPWVRFAVDELQVAEEPKDQGTIAGDFPDRVTPREMDQIRDYLTHCAEALMYKLGRKRCENVKQLRQSVGFVKKGKFDWESLQKILCSDDL